MHKSAQDILQTTCKEQHAGFKAVFNQGCNHQVWPRVLVKVKVIRGKRRGRGGYLSMWQQSSKDDPKACDGGVLDQLGREIVLRGGWGLGSIKGFPVRSKQIDSEGRASSSSSSSLPSAPAAGGGAAASNISAAGLVLAHFRLHLLATVVTVVVTMVLLVERYRSRHGAHHSWYKPWVSEFLAAYVFVCLVSSCWRAGGFIVIIIYCRFHWILDATDVFFCFFFLELAASTCWPCFYILQHVPHGWTWGVILGL